VTEVVSKEFIQATLPDLESARGSLPGLTAWTKFSVIESKLQTKTMVRFTHILNTHFPQLDSWQLLQA
jgi:hypothetical protein